MSTHRKKCAVMALETLEGRRLMSAAPLLGTSYNAAAVGFDTVRAPLGVVADVGLKVSNVAAASRPGVHANSLVGMVAALSIKNTTTGVINYQLRWSNSGAWVSYSLNPGVTRSHSIATSWDGTSTARPSIRFDKSFDRGFQEQIYALTTKNEVEHARDNFYLGKEYLFKKSGNGVNLFQKA